MKNGLIFILGNKCDLEAERCIESEVAADKMRQFGLPYFEVSAKTGYNIE
jgi:GTPase SAR1 family protein